MSSYKCSTDWDDDECFTDVADIRDKIKEPFAKEFNKNVKVIDSMSLNGLGLYADIIFAEDFELLPGNGHDFSEGNWETMYRMLNSLLLDPFSDHTR